MQAVEIKRLAVHRIGIAAVAIGTLAAGLVGASALYDTTNDSDVGAVAVTHNVAGPSAADTMRFLEWNTNLPALSARSVQSAAEIQFLEWNTLMPGQSGRPVQSFADMTFLDWNTTLPGAAAREVDSYSTLRLLEMNALPGDDAPYLPSPSEPQSIGAETGF